MTNNPYAAPRSAVTDVTPEARKRPLLVWIITIFMAFGIVSGIASSALALSGKPLGGQATADYMKSVGITPVDHVYTIIVMLISGIGYVDLFRLKKRALPILAALFAAGFVHLGIKAAIEPAYRGMFASPASLWPILAGWVINLLIIGYVWWLRRKSVLR